MKVRTTIGLTTVLLFWATLPLAGQDARGTLLGRVSDPSNAVIRYQFTAAFINALNHPQFVPPITAPTSSAFGQLTGAYNWQRIIQFGLKLSF